MLSRRARLRRTAILCGHCLRNLAFFRAMQDMELNETTQQYWVTARNNFLDTGILEWCKVFGDHKAKHFWGKTVTDRDGFSAALLQHLGRADAEFAGYITDMRAYRDKFLAHLDEENRMEIPALDMAIHSAQFLYDRLINAENDCNAFPTGPPVDAAVFYGRFLVEGQAARQVVPEG